MPTLVPDGRSGVAVTLFDVSEPQSPPPPHPRPLNVIDTHLGLLSALALVVLSCLRVYGATGFHLPTALSVLTVLDRAQLLASTVLVVLIYAIPLAVLVAWHPLRAWARQAPRDGGFTGWVESAIPAILLGWGVIAPVWEIMAWIVAGFAWYVLLPLGRKVRRKFVARDGASAESPGRSLVHPAAYVLNPIALLGLLALAVVTPWLPLEAIELQGREEKVVGRVVGTQAEMTLLLERIEVQWVKTDSLEKRSLCGQDESWWSTSFVELLWQGELFFDSKRDPGPDCAAIRDGEFQE